jgi:hypothetical protein
MSAYKISLRNDLREVDELPDRVDLNLGDKI